MAKEIERKYLLGQVGALNLGIGAKIKQGYFETKGLTTRVRILDDKAFFCMKSDSKGISRDEYEYEIPLQDGIELFQYCTSSLEKTRYKIQHKGYTWEVDLFDGNLSGLILAEVELEDSDTIPPLLDEVIEDVSENPKYKNSNLARANEARGYHSRKIQRGVLGEPSKIREELEELEDALDQNNRIMALVELSDLYGALKAVANTLGTNMSELSTMHDATEKAFKDGIRKSRV